MQTIELPLAIATLGELIEQAQQGEAVAIADDGHVVAMLVAVSSYPRDQILAAITAIKAMRTGAINREEFVAMRRSGRL